MQATVVIGLAVYVLWRDHRLKGTPQQTWPGWCSPIAFHAKLAYRCLSLQVHVGPVICYFNCHRRCTSQVWNTEVTRIESVGSERPR